MICLLKEWGLAAGQQLSLLADRCIVACWGLLVVEWVPFHDDDRIGEHQWLLSVVRVSLLVQPAQGVVVRWVIGNALDHYVVSE